MSNKMEYVEESQPRPRRTGAGQTAEAGGQTAGKPPAPRTRAAKTAAAKTTSARTTPAKTAARSARSSAPATKAPAATAAEEFETVEEPLSGDPGGTEPAAGLPRRRPRGSRLPLIGAALAVLVVAGLVVSILEWTGARSRYDSQQSLRSSALSAASTYGVYLSSYDYKDLNGPNSPWADVDSHSTDSFRKDFDATKSNLSSLVNDYKATATGKVIAAGLSSVSSTRAVALLFVDQTVTNTAQKPGTTVQPLRVELVMARQHGRWLIDKLEVPS